MDRPCTIQLAPVDEAVLAQLTETATSDASANDVTPPLTPGEEWTPGRIAWFEAYHRSRRTGLSGSAGEATWAVLHSNDPVGAVRLQLTETDGELETGIWLARAARGAGISRGALRLVLEEARSQGAHTVRASTTVSNTASQAMLRSAGFSLAEPMEDGSIRAARRVT